jgi:hypothetical protein
MNGDVRQAGDQNEGGSNQSKHSYYDVWILTWLGHFNNEG